MNSEAIVTARAAYADDAAFIAAANVETANWDETWIRWTTVAGEFGAAAADQVFAALAGVSPSRAAAFVNPGFDLGNANTRSEMQAMADAQPAMAGLVDWALAQGRTLTRPCEAWGVDEMTAEVLAAARRDVAIMAASAACLDAATAGQMAANADPFDTAAIKAAVMASLDGAWLNG